ncbi:MAG: carboxypeptidase-like regulatory domain-containing protein [Bacteroidia bacterium]|nr:carboxypeptidase-like regulatory domain-containing protein [Bacteroidia bacterium]
MATQFLTPEPMLKPSMKNLLPIMLFFLAGNFCDAQTLIGTVIDRETGETLPEIIVKSGSKGMVTDANGRFHLDIQNGESLEFTQIGYPKHEIININLEQDTVNIGLIGLSPGGTSGFVMYKKKRFLSQKPKYVCRYTKTNVKVKPENLIVRGQDGQPRYTWIANKEGTLQVEFSKIDNCTNHSSK